MQPKAGISSTDRGRICPKAATTMVSGFNSNNCRLVSADLKFSGCKTVRLCRSAAFLTGGSSTTRPLPAALSGWV